MKQTQNYANEKKNMFSELEFIYSIQKTKRNKKEVLQFSMYRFFHRRSQTERDTF